MKSFDIIFNTLMMSLIHIIIDIALTPPDSEQSCKASRRGL